MFKILADTIRTATLTAPRRDMPEVPPRRTFRWWRQDKAANRPELTRTFSR